MLVSRAFIDGAAWEYTRVSKQAKRVSVELGAPYAAYAPFDLSDQPLLVREFESLSTALFGNPFLQSSGLVLWMDNVDPNLLIGDGKVANPADCSGRQTFATDLDFWFTVKDEGVIFSDETDVDFSTLKFAKTPGGTMWMAGGAKTVQPRLSRFYSLVLPDYDKIVFEFDSGHTDVDGIYLGRLPFGPGAMMPAPM